MMQSAVVSEPETLGNPEFWTSLTHQHTEVKKIETEIKSNEA